MPSVIAAGNRLKSPWLIAGMLTLALTLYILSAILLPPTETPLAERHEAPLARVQVQHFSATPIEREVELYGRTQAERMATLGAEVSGRVVAVPVERGALVKQGEVLVRLDERDLRQQLARAQALLDQRRIEYDGAARLDEKGFTGRARLAEAKANLVDAEATVASLQLDLANTSIRAPFDGVLNERLVEVGDYLAVGDPIARVHDIDPLVVKASVTEQHIASLRPGQPARVRMLDGQLVTGTLRYLSRVADADSATFAIEVAIANAHGQWLAGQSAAVLLPLGQTEAIKVTPALLALDEQGRIGIKSVVDSTVAFTPVQIVKSERDGLWLSGLGRDIDIITLGQGFVRAGDRVVAEFKR